MIEFLESNSLSQFYVINSRMPVKLHQKIGFSDKLFQKNFIKKLLQYAQRPCRFGT